MRYLYDMITINDSLLIPLDRSNSEYNFRLFFTSQTISLNNAFKYDSEPNIRRLANLQLVTAVEKLSFQRVSMGNWAELNQKYFTFWMRRRFEDLFVFYCIKARKVFVAEFETFSSLFPPPPFHPHPPKKGYRWASNSWRKFWRRKEERNINKATIQNFMQPSKCCVKMKTSQTVYSGRSVLSRRQMTKKEKGYRGHWLQQ